jgi:hypothetical protein
LSCSFSLRQRKKALAFCLGVRGLTSPPIGEALSPSAGDGFCGAFKVTLIACIVAEIKLSSVAFQVQVLVDAAHASRRPSALLRAAEFGHGYLDQRQN